MAISCNISRSRVFRNCIYRYALVFGLQQTTRSFKTLVRTIQKLPTSLAKPKKKQELTMETKRNLRTQIKQKCTGGGLPPGPLGGPPLTIEPGGGPPCIGGGP